MAQNSVTETMNEAQKAQALIKMLPPAQLAAVVKLLEAIIDPVAIAIANAPFDDQPITAEEARALEEGREWLKNNPKIPHEEVLAELGITPEEIERFKEPR
jgi:hypothetical protein